MSGPKRNPDKLNTIGVVVVGICGAVLVYVTIVALQAFYVNDTAEVQNTADYGGQDTALKSLRAAQMGTINDYKPNSKPAEPKAGEAAKSQTYHVPIEVAMKHVVEDAKADPGNLIPAVGRSDKATVLPIFGRPKPIPTAPPAAPASAPAGDAAATPAGAAAGSATTLPAAPQVPTGAGTGPAAPVGGAGPLATPSPNPPPKVAPATAPKGNGQ
jgi:hypothetical protein